MFVKKYKINASTLSTGTTEISIQIPLSGEFEFTNQNELIETKFVQSEVEKAINPILDYEKVRFLPIDSNLNHIDKITYNLNLSGATTYGEIGFSDDDIKYNKNNFKESFLNLAFYDSDNTLDQKLITYLTLFTKLTQTDLLQSGSTSGMPGQPKPATQIGLSFTVSNPIINPIGESEGYHLYDYKDELTIGKYKYLYMRASFKNAKTGKSTNLMVENSPSIIDELVKKLYTRFKLIRTNTGFYYVIDDSYHGDGSLGSNNVVYNTNTVTINLFQIIAL